MKKLTYWTTKGLNTINEHMMIYAKHKADEGDRAEERAIRKALHWIDQQRIRYENRRQPKSIGSLLAELKQCDTKMQEINRNNVELARLITEIRTGPTNDERNEP